MWLCDICVYIVKYMFHGKFAFSIQNYILYPAENLGIIFGCSQNMSLCKIPQFHYLPFVKILWKATVSAKTVRFAEKLCENCAFPKISTPGNFVKFRYFTQCIPLDQNQFCPPMPKLKLHLSNIAYKTENETSKPKNSD